MAPRKYMHIMVAALAVSCGLLAVPAGAQERPEREALILSPEAGTAVSNPVMVAFGVQSQDGDNEQPSDAGGNWNGGNHAWTPHAFLAVDTPAPPVGALVQAGTQYIPFPDGQTQMSVTLPPGPHQLQIVIVNRKGYVSKYVFAARPIAIIVQP